MRPEEVIEALRGVAPRLREEYGVVGVLLFGSFVRGDAGSGSDVDVLVELGRGLTLFDLGRLQADLEELLGMPVDVAPVDSLRERAREAILSEARRVA